MTLPTAPTAEEHGEHYPDKEGGSFVNPGECGSASCGDFVGGRPPDPDPVAKIVAPDKPHPAPHAAPHAAKPRVHSK